MWLMLSGTGALVSVLSLRELRAGVEAIRKVALGRPHAHDVIHMAQHNEGSEMARLLAQSLFFGVGVASFFSKPPVVLSRPRPIDRVLPWVLVLVEAILVGNSVSEYVVSQQVLKRRAGLQSRSEATP